MRTSLKELEQKLKEKLEPALRDSVLAAVKEREDELDRKMRELDERTTERMRSLQAPPERGKDPGSGAGLVIRAFAAARGDADRMSKHLTDWGASEEVKNLVSNVASAGGLLLPEPMSREIIELLRPRAVVRRMNPTVLPMDDGVLNVPKLTGGATAEYIGEATAQNATEPATGQLRLTWKKLRATVPISNELLRFAAVNANMVVRDDIVAGMATREDRGFIRDDGTQDRPRGLRFWAPAANATASNGDTLANIEQDLRELVQALEGSDVRMLRPGFIMSPREKNDLIMQRDGNGNLAFPELRTANPTLLGLPVAWTNNIPTDLNGNESEVYLVDFADAVIGEASQIELVVSNEASYTDSNGTLVSAFDRDETVIKAISRHDFGMRHDESIAVKTGVTWGVA